MATQDPMCWAAWQTDTNAMWNWNGLYREGVAGNHQGAIPDGTLCSGGLTGDGRYRAMDTPGLWRATNLSNNFTLQAHDQARHGSDYYRVYVTRQGYNATTTALRWGDLELVATTPKIAPGVGSTTNDPVLNGVTISIPVSAPGRTGRHVVYTIWQASHSDQSYYFCSDVIFPGGSGEPTTAPTTTAPTTTAPTTTPPTTRPPTTTPTTPPRTTPPATSQPTTPPGSTGAPGSCSATYTVFGQWSGGFQGEVRVAAGSTAIRGWTVNWTYANGQTISSAWGSTITASGAAVTARNVAYNGSLSPAASVTFGFLGSWTGTNSVPALTCTAS